MPQANKITVNFAAGELSPRMYGRIDLPVYAKGLALCKNFIVLQQGGLSFRTGSIMVKQTKLNKLASFVPFQFNDSQSYLLEMTNTFFRVFMDESVVTLAPKNITGITNANPVVVSSAGHGYSDGDEIYVLGVQGMPQVNGRFYLVAGSATNTFTLQSIEGASVDGTNYGVYTGSGTAAKVYEVGSTPYLEADIENLQHAQDADTMYIANRNYEPGKLVRSGHASWALDNNYSRAGDPFNGAGNYPRAVTFTDDARSGWGGTDNNPSTIWLSAAPNGATTRFDTFTPGTDATDPVIVTLAPVNGKVDVIQALSTLTNYIAALTFGGIRRIYGSSEAAGLSPESFNAKPASTFGAAPTIPITDGSGLFYIQRGGKFLRSLEYEYQINGYSTGDRTLAAQHLAQPGLKQMVSTQGAPDVMWITRNDGRFLGLTFSLKENISAWHQHYIAGKHKNSDGVMVDNAKVLWVGKMPRENDTDQLWLIVERRIGDNTIRTVEYLADEVQYPNQADFYTGPDNERADDQRYRNAMYEAHKDAIYVDMATTYDGTDNGVNAGVSITPSAITGDNISFTSAVITGTDLTPIINPTDVFTSDMVGRQLWKIYDLKGEGGGKAEITEFIDKRTVRAKVLVDFNDTTAMKPGRWYLTTDRVYGLDHLSGQTVDIIADGGVHTSTMVNEGTVLLDGHYSKVHVGLKYRGTVEMLNQDIGGVTGSAQGKNRNVTKMVTRFLNTIGVQVGTMIYSLSRHLFATGKDQLNRPTLPFSGNKEQPYVTDSWTDDEKKIVYVQDEPQPCTILSVDVYADTADE